MSVYVFYFINFFSVYIIYIFRFLFKFIIYFRYCISLNFINFSLKLLESVKYINVYVDIFFCDWEGGNWCSIWEIVKIIF